MIKSTPGATETSSSGPVATIRSPRIITVEGTLGLSEAGSRRTTPTKARLPSRAGGAGAHPHSIAARKAHTSDVLTCRMPGYAPRPCEFRTVQLNRLDARICGTDRLTVVRSTRQQSVSRVCAATSNLFRSLLRRFSDPLVETGVFAGPPLCILEIGVSKLVVRHDLRG